MYKSTMESYLSQEDIINKWEQTLSSEKPEGMLHCLYIDSPFCLKFCDFCLYKPTILKDKEIDDIKNKYYEELLPDQIHTFGNIISKMGIDTVYFGGGTSDIMTDTQMLHIFETLQKYFDFKNAPKEKTFELNPVSLTPEKIQLLKEWNFTHVTMGVQSFHKEILKKNNRVNLSVEKMQPIFKYFADANIQVNMDLMVFIYNDNDTEDISLLLEDVEIAMNKLSPDRITIFPNYFRLLDLKLQYKHHTIKKSLSLVWKKITLLRKSLKKIHHPEYEMQFPEDKVTVKNHRQNYFFLKKGNYKPYIYNCTGWTLEERHWLTNQCVLALGGYGKRKPYSYIGDTFCYHNELETDSFKYPITYSE